ncbi:hypothetical protein EUZ85_02250 [Hahella sp. KA22]|uniref:hypothetical protein n=1 Tax=Hahella sp. KA22 TaxID=1628392 RepID=UPI000FDD2256|nr:hypothetical protein [Hahella sp. KA22]AZZ95315.1 hypothetical protein ENC22_30540 [Hahella sp. KA22]QAY52960.1 hypothetical protein EUZ85_02250 [Hahella sp. KA22]
MNKGRSICWRPFSLEAAGVMVILLKYKLRSEDQWRSKRFSPYEYFDLEEGEVPEIDSVPDKMHAAEYLDLPGEEVEHTLLQLVDEDKSELLEVKETFWNAGENRIIEVLRKSGNDVLHNELIIQTIRSNLAMGEEIETVRFNREKLCNTLNFHSIDCI